MAEAAGFVPAHFMQGLCEHTRKLCGLEQGCGHARQLLAVSSPEGFCSISVPFLTTSFRYPVLNQASIGMEHWDSFALGMPALPPALPDSRPEPTLGLSPGPVWKTSGLPFLLFSSSSYLYIQQKQMHIPSCPICLCPALAPAKLQVWTLHHELPHTCSPCPGGEPLLL